MQFWYSRKKFDYAHSPLMILKNIKNFRDCFKFQKNILRYKINYRESS